ncbi:hypothetical protein D3C72_2297670 [compost metagenome]
MQSNKIRFRPVAEGERFVGLEPVEQRIRTTFIGNVFTHQQERSLRSLEFAHHVVSKQQR